MTTPTTCFDWETWSGRWEELRGVTPRTGRTNQIGESAFTDLEQQEIVEQFASFAWDPTRETNPHVEVIVSPYGFYPCDLYRSNSTRFPHWMATDWLASDDGAHWWLPLQWRQPLVDEPVDQWVIRVHFALVSLGLADPDTGARRGFTTKILELGDLPRIKDQLEHDRKHPMFTDMAFEVSLDVAETRREAELLLLELNELNNPTAN